MNAKVSEKGQVTIPKEIRDRLGIHPGEVLDFEAVGGELIARKTDSRDPIDLLYGALELPDRPDALLDELRGPGPATP